MKYAEIACREGYTEILNALALIEEKAKHNAALTCLAGSYKNTEVFLALIDGVNELTQKVSQALKDLEHE